PPMPDQRLPIIRQRRQRALPPLRIHRLHLHKPIQIRPLNLVQAQRHLLPTESHHQRLSHPPVLPHVPTPPQTNSQSSLPLLFQLLTPNFLPLTSCCLLLRHPSCKSTPAALKTTDDFTSASTTSGSNCVPFPPSIPFNASSCDIAGL